MYVQNERTVLQYRVRSMYTEYINSVLVDIHEMMCDESFNCMSWMKRYKDYMNKGMQITSTIAAKRKLNANDEKLFAIVVRIVFIHRVRSSIVVVVISERILGLDSFSLSLTPGLLVLSTLLRQWLIIHQCNDISLHIIC